MNVFDEYAAWTDTVAKYPPTAEPFYLALGIADEVGEFDSTYAPEDVLKESGDVLWYCARYATRVLKVPFSDVVAEACMVTDSVDVQFSVECGTICGVEKKRIRDGELWDDEKTRQKRIVAGKALVRIVACIRARIYDCGLHTLEDSIQVNIGKLSARLAAGTIQGDGDNR